jgi:Acetyltransferase (GNAT) domain
MSSSCARTTAALLPPTTATTLQSPPPTIRSRAGSAKRCCVGGAALYGRGLGTKATRLVLAFAFGALDLHRVELEVYDFNPRARRVYEKVGFVVEGVRRDALWWDGAWHGAVMMAILAPEWHA